MVFFLFLRNLLEYSILYFSCLVIFVLLNIYNIAINIIYRDYCSEVGTRPRRSSWHALLCIIIIIIIIIIIVVITRNHQ